MNSQINISERGKAENSVHLKNNCNCNYSACTDKKLMRRVFSFITSLWSVGLLQISVLSVFRKMWCNSWCNTIFQKVFNAEYYTFAVSGMLNGCASIRLPWCNTLESITPVLH